MRDKSAFPCNWQEREAAWGELKDRHDAGMTLLDYFAAKAMQAMISTAASSCLGGLEGAEQELANAAYRIADAMMEARR